jgi:uncharacterized protein (DUF1697 family)
VRQIVLLRGINLGSRNRVSMPALRELFAGAGFDDVRTYLQSGNVVLSSDLTPEQLARECAALIERELGLGLEVVVRTSKELAAVVRRNPLGDVATDPKRYQVSFLAGKLPAAKVRELEQLAAPGERLVADGRELYAWHPDGVARSKLWAGLAGKLGVAATARNWRTVEAIMELV